jgi:hypothetical protein
VYADFYDCPTVPAKARSFTSHLVCLTGFVVRFGVLVSKPKKIRRRLPLHARSISIAYRSPTSCPGARAGATPYTDASCGIAPGIVCTYTMHLRVYSHKAPDLERV